MNQLQALYDRLKKHDWYYQMSDDHRVWRSGQSDWNEITKIANATKGGIELQVAFSVHYYTGEPWGNEQQPMPERPKDTEFPNGVDIGDIAESRRQA